MKIYKMSHHGHERTITMDPCQEKSAFLKRYRVYLHLEEIYEENKNREVYIHLSQKGAYTSIGQVVVPKLEITTS